MLFRSIKDTDKTKKAINLLKRVGITEEKGNRRVLQLSGGEQQRVAIARALSYDSKIILADEPTGNLDGENEAEIIALLQELAHKDNKCVIIVSHSKVIKECVDELIYLEKGSIKGM